jgi:Uma2 family endonuclease
MAPAVLEPPRSTTKPASPVVVPQSDAMVDSEALFEVIQGKRVELPKMSSYSCMISIWIYNALNSYVQENQRGITVFEMLFGIPTKGDPGKQRRPDVAFISKSRWPIDQVPPDTDPFPAVPNLAIEVLSPSDRILDLNSKLKDYFEAGVELVWVVHPSIERVDSFTSPIKPQYFFKADNLTAETLLPGFSLPLATIFRG